MIDLQDPPTDTNGTDNTEPPETTNEERRCQFTRGPSTPCPLSVFFQLRRFHEARLIDSCHAHVAEMMNDGKTERWVVTVLVLEEERAAKQALDRLQSEPLGERN